MKYTKKRLIALVSTFLALAMLSSVPSAAPPAAPDDGECFTVLVGKDARDNLLHTRILELEQAVEADYGPRLAMLERKLFPVEKAFIEDRPKFEEEFAALYTENRKAALKSLDDYVAAAFAEVADRTAKLIEKLKGR